MTNTEQLNANGIIMIVDDTPENLALLSDTLSEAGYRVLVATDGMSAIEQVDYLKPDLILLDVLMPGIDGFETCRRLKSSAATQNIPVLFMTALAELDHLLRGFGEGAVDYIVKPIRPPEVLARIDAQLAQLRHIKRAEDAFAAGSLAMLACTADGALTWTTPAGRDWLAQLIQASPSKQEPSSASVLPEPLLNWFLANVKAQTASENRVFDFYADGAAYSAKLLPCQNTGEYLLTCTLRTSQWKLESMRHSLNLTLREAEILMWISRGKTNKEIGLILGSSPRTVNKHLEHIFEKLGVATRAAAVSVAIETTRL